MSANVVIVVRSFPLYVHLLSTLFPTVVSRGKQWSFLAVNSLRSSFLIASITVAGLSQPALPEHTLSDPRDLPRDHTMSP